MLIEFDLSRKFCPVLIILNLLVNVISSDFKLKCIFILCSICTRSINYLKNKVIFAYLLIWVVDLYFCGLQ